MAPPRLIINGLALPYQSDAISQTYETFGGFELLRFANGTGLVQERWRKRRTTISAQHHAPPGLFAIDWMAPVTIACVGAEAIQSASPAIVLPAARRNDVAPYGFALTDGIHHIPTPGVLVGNTLTLNAVAGATAYIAHYFPLITAFAPAGPALRTDQVGLVIGWELQAEEV